MTMETAVSVLFGLVTGVSIFGTIVAYQANNIFTSTIGAVFATMFGFLSLAVSLSN